MILEEFEKIASTTSNFQNSLNLQIKKQFSKVFRGEEYLSDVEERLKSIKKPIVYGLTDTYDTTFMAYTSEYKYDIEVRLRRNILEKNLISVLIHELGEVDYLSRGNPVLIDSEGNLAFIKIVEMFSHKHSRELSSDYGLEEIEGDFREIDNEVLISNYEAELFSSTLEEVIYICWLFSTFPKIILDKNKLSGYLKNVEIVDNITNIVYNTHTISDPVGVEFSMEEIINLLGIYNFHESVYVKPRRDILNS